MTVNSGSDTLADGLRHVFRHSVSGVFIVTTTTAAGIPVGCTASSVASVSLTPPVVSFSLQAGSSVCEHISQRGEVYIHSLAVEHAHLAAQFATSGIDRFAGVTWSAVDGLPLLSSTCSAMRASIVHEIPVGQSRLFLAELSDVTINDLSSEPLGHSARRYVRAVPLTD